MFAGRGAPLIYILYFFYSSPFLWCLSLEKQNRNNRKKERKKKIVVPPTNGSVFIGGLGIKFTKQAAK